MTHEWPADERRWYALVVKPRYESIAAEALRHCGLEECAPTYRAKRRWSDRIKEVQVPLFAGYVLCRFSFEERLLALRALGVKRIVSFGGVPRAVEDEEVDSIRRIVQSGVAVQPYPYLRPGCRVRVTEGCLAGLCGTLIRDKDIYRIVVSIELLQRSVAVELDRDGIYPIPDPAPANGPAYIPLTFHPENLPSIQTH
jgi:transcription termination/antitermination protein NusG